MNQPQHQLIKKTVDGSDVVSIKFHPERNIYQGRIQYRDAKGSIQVESLVWTVSGKTKNPDKNLRLP